MISIRYVFDSSTIFCVVTRIKMNVCVWSVVVKKEYGDKKTDVESDFI